MGSACLVSASVSQVLVRGGDVRSEKEVCVQADKWPHNLLPLGCADNKPHAAAVARRVVPTVPGKRTSF